MRSPSTRLGAIFLSAALMIAPTLLLLNVPPAAAQSFWERLFQRRRSADQQASGRTRGGAVRDTVCSADAVDKSLVALVPESNLGDTVESHPTFFFYVPFSSSENDDLVAEFMMITDDRQYWLAEPLRVTLPQAPGIVRLQLPTSSPGLEVGDRYNWYFSVLCEDWERSRNPFVSGWVERVSPDVPPEPVPPELDPLESVEPINTASTRTADTWHETLLLLTQRLPEERDTWNAFLGTYDLDHLSDQPIEDLMPLN